MAAQYTKKDDALIVKPDVVSVGINEARDFLANLKIHSGRYAFLIFDFSEVTEITGSALRTLTFSVSIAAEMNAKVVIVGSSIIKQCIYDCNLDRIFSYYSSVEYVFENNSPTSILRQTLAASLAEAIETTFTTITGSDAQALPADSNVQHYNNSFEIGAIIGVNDRSFKGSLILGFSTKTYLSLMSKMFGTTYSEITTEISDGPAEILNMIFGNLKIDLNNKGFSLTQAIPTTIMGSNLHIVPSKSKSSPIVLLYDTKFGSFYAEMSTNYGSLKVAA